MKHTNAHKLDLACLDCIRVHLEQKRRLLNFVRKIASKPFDDPYWYEANTSYDLPTEAQQILKEIDNE